MCGRYVCYQSTSDIAEAFDVTEILLDWQPSFNIAPTQIVPAVVHTNARKLVGLKWGLVPSWAKDASMAAKMINARCETLLEKPSFKEAFLKRRCLIIANGFYEWQTKGETKQPLYIHLQNKQPMSLAGLYEHWRSPEGVISTCTIVTTAANPLLEPIHSRMPVILTPEQQGIWLDPECHDSQQLQALLQPYPANSMAFYPVNPQINRYTFNEPACLDPYAQ